MTVSAWDGVVRLRAPSTLRDLATRFGGETSAGGGEALVSRVVPVDHAGDGDMAPLLGSRYVRAANDALQRGASVLADASLAATLKGGCRVWTHGRATWALAFLLDECDAPAIAATYGPGTVRGEHAVLFDRVVIGRNVEIGAGAVIGAPGFGWATGPRGEVRRVPQLAGVVIEDDVSIGPLCTIDAGTLSPTRIRSGAKLDAHVHVGHNAQIGEGSILAAQCGLAGSVVIGRGVLVGGQAGFADHVVVGDGARVAAKSGVIGDVPAGAIVAGYPAVKRTRWLRALARLYRGVQ
jgi:UDP-3-O-[3-hydroxymyristoyl] glucosamine N-acyltransferase